MAVGSQYGEDLVLEDFFRGQEKGFLVDVGAADGQDNSNSWNLLKRPGWGGILIEPEISQFKVLEKRYKDRQNVKCVQCAIGSSPGMTTIFCSKQVSTLLPSWRDRCIEVHGVPYTEQLVAVRTLTTVLDWLGLTPTFDFLSIDCEGMDYEVLQSLDLSRFTPKLICLECKGVTIPGYQTLCSTGGNTFYVKS